MSKTASALEAKIGLASTLSFQRRYIAVSHEITTPATGLGRSMAPTMPCMNGVERA